MLDLDIMQAATLADMATCVNHYRMYTPGVFVCVHPQVRLNENHVFAPGLVAQVNSGQFKQCEVQDLQYFNGPPNFIFDVYRDDQRSEIEGRKAAFEKAGVIEYVLWNTTTKEPAWLRLADGRLLEVPLLAGVTIESTALPGLRFPVDAFRQRDWRRIQAAISDGITRPAHRDFMATVWKK